MRELALHVLDIVQNSIEAGADLVEIEIREIELRNELVLKISDDGRGMTEEEQEKVVDPFVTSRTTRQVGLGLPLLKRAARQCAGSFELESRLGEGTTVTVTFEHDHIDRAPLGDMVSTVITILKPNPQLDLLYCHQIDEEEFVFDTREIKRELEDVKINNPQILSWIREYLEENLAELRR